MKRKLTLYIGEVAWQHPADIGDDTFILYNWSNGDLTDPTQVKNSWSRQITLPGTSNNDLIFGMVGQHDHSQAYGVQGGTGIYFDPSVRTPFQLFDDAGQILDRGYLKLDEVTQTGSTHEYKCTLYGGLGGFLYNLTYSATGDKRTLADLIYKDHGGNVVDMDFTINHTTVADAWDFLENNSSPHYLQNDKWDFLNFAPAYNGLPKGAFSPDKALVDVQRAGLPFLVDGYTPYGGGRTVLVNIPSAKTEWETGDLRSYLQRPVFRLGAIMEACADPDNNGGYTVELYETIFDPVLSANEYIWSTWLTLPMLTSMKVDRGASSGTFTVTTGSNTIPTTGGAATEFTITAAPKIGSGSGTRYLHCLDYTIQVNWIEIEMKFYRPNNTVGMTKTFRFSSLDAQEVNVTNVGTFDASGNWTGSPAVVSWSNPSGVGNELYSRVVVTVTNGGRAFGYMAVPSRVGYVWTDTSDDDSRATYTDSPVYSASYSTSAVESLRSNMPVSVSDLLRTQHTPADYFLSVVKMLGLRIAYDPALNKITVFPRGQYYGGGTIDLSQRINRSKPIVTVPFVFDKRWYAFGEKYAQGEWAQYYASIFGRTYGTQMVDTGFEFDAATEDVMGGVVFNGAVQILEYSKYFVGITDGGNYPPAFFLDAGGNYDLYDGAGNTKNVSVPVPDVSTATITALNSGYPGYDWMDKPQFHNADNVAYDERDTLLFFAGMQDVPSGADIRLTDDSQTMMLLNNNTPCWDMASGYPLLKVPHFSRYCTMVDGKYYSSLDFGVPAEIPIPDVELFEYAPIYRRYWQDFIGDRLSVDTRVVRCFVNWDGYQVGQDLLRNFYWFDGSLWSLNKIINYSMTTWDDTECEFIKVQDTNNY